MNIACIGSQGCASEGLQQTVDLTFHAFLLAGFCEVWLVTYPHKVGLQGVQQLEDKQNNKRHSNITPSWGGGGGEGRGGKRGVWVAEESGEEKTGKNSEQKSDSLRASPPGQSDGEAGKGVSNYVSVI